MIDEFKTKFSDYNKNDINKQLLLIYLLKDKDQYKYFFTESVDYKDNMVIALEDVKRKQRNYLVGNF